MPHRSTNYHWMIFDRGCWLWARIQQEGLVGVVCVGWWEPWHWHWCLQTGTGVHATAGPCTVPCPLPGLVVPTWLPPSPPPPHNTHPVLYTLYSKHPVPYTAHTKHPVLYTVYSKHPVLNNLQYILYWTLYTTNYTPCMLYTHWSGQARYSHSGYWAPWENR